MAQSQHYYVPHGSNWPIVGAIGLFVLMLGVAGIACAAIFVRLALPAPPVAVGFHRMAIATALVAGFIAVRGARRPEPRSAVLALAAGVAFGTDLALWNTAVVETSVATATLLVNTTPVIVGAWAVLFEKQRLDRRFLGGVALALAAVDYRR